MYSDNHINLGFDSNDSLALVDKTGVNKGTRRALPIEVLDESIEQSVDSEFKMPELRRVPHHSYLLPKNTSK
jgi:hypothetical protein